MRTCNDDCMNCDLAFKSTSKAFKECLTRRGVGKGKFIIEVNNPAFGWVAVRNDKGPIVYSSFQKAQAAMRAFYQGVPTMARVTKIE